MERRRATRRSVLRATLAFLGAGACLDEAAAGMPPPPPQPLDRLVPRATFVVTGSPRRFRFVSREGDKAFRERRASDDEYKQLLSANASDAVLREYWRERIDPEPFRLRDEAGAPGEHTPAFLEFDVHRVLFRNNQQLDKDLSGERRIYVSMLSQLSMEPHRRGWEQHFGQRVILLMGGLLSPRSVAFRPYPFPAHGLILAHHMDEVLPVPYTLLPSVLQIARGLPHFERIEAP